MEWCYFDVSCASAIVIIGEVSGIGREQMTAANDRFAEHKGVM